MNALIVAAVALGALAAPAGAEVVETITRRIPLESAKAVRVELPLGELRLVAGEGSQVEILARVHCKGWDSRCAERARNLSMEATRRGTTLRIEPRGLPRISRRGMWIETEIRVPRSLDVEVEMGVGELVVDGVGGNVDVCLGVGEATVTVAENQVGSARVRVGIGEATLDSSSGTSQIAGLFGHNITWNEGSGRNRVSLRLGIGEADLALR
jgi:hypothetical protein